MRIRGLAPTLSLATLLGVGVSVSARAAESASSLPVEQGEATDAERAAFAAALERFETYADEVRTDTLRWVATQKQEQLDALRSSFDRRVVDLEELERSRRDEAIRAFEAFLRRHDDIRLTSDVRVRLAELYFQEAEERWLAETTRYFEAVDEAGDDLDRLAQLEARGEPKIDLSRVIGLLRSVIDANAGLPLADQYPLLDVTFYTLAYAYSDQRSKQFDREEARRVFRELTVARPNSDYADAAHLMLGLYAFQDDDYEGSIPEFEAVLARGMENTKRKNFENALYQLAWARYKLNEYDQAMTLFSQLLQLSKDRLESTGRESEFSRDATAYLALSLVDTADMLSVEPLQRAIDYYAGARANAPYKWEVIVELARSLERYGRPLDAVEVYEYLQTTPEFKDRPENPDFQDTVVKLLTRGYDADLVRAGQARLEMTERYGEGSEWWVANRANPEAQERARAYIEAYLLEVAIELKVRAVQANDPALFLAAAQKYREYLDRFPISDGYYANQLQLADALLQAGEYGQAAAEFERLVASRDAHEFGDPAIYFLFTSRLELMRAAGYPPEKRAGDAEVERTYTTAGGAEITVYELKDSQAAFIEAADTVVDHEFGAPTLEGVPDFRPVVKEKRAAILYTPAQVLYFANRFDEARPRLLKVIKEHPRTDEAAFAANLIVNSYIDEKDSAAVRKWSKEFSGMALGAPSGDTADLTAKFADTYQRTVYQIGVDAMEAGEYQAAVDAFLGFMAEFPKSPNVPDAMLSAAAAHEKLGRAADANALYERFLREFPDHPDAKPFYFRIASNYEATFQLAEATAYYEQFVRRYPDDRNAKDAQYMVAFLKEGQGQYLAAAQGYEAYAAKYPDAEDRAVVHFRAGKMYELADTDRAIQFYKRYLSTYGLSVPDDAIAAQARLAALYAKQGKTRDATRATSDIVELYRKAAAAGVSIGARGRDLAAAAAFPDLQAKYDKVVSASLSKDEKKNTKLLFEDMPAAVSGFDAEAQAFIETFLSFEYTTAAMYLKGETRHFYADLGLSLTPPESLTMDQQDAYWELLEEQLFPQFRGVEEQAVEQLKSVIELARTQKRHSIWVDKAREALNDIDPTTYPAVKQPIAVEVEAVEPQTVDPIAPPATVEE